MLCVTLGKGRRAGVQAEAWTGVTRIMELAPLMLAPAEERDHGALPVQPVLVCAAAGTGKTWASQQLTYELSRRCLQAPRRGVQFVPLLVYVQALARLLDTPAGASASSVNLLVQCECHGPRSRPCTAAAP